MSEPERFEYLILGSGEAGSLLAWHMAGSGRPIAVVERRWVGGACPNIACLPSKNEIWSARIAHLTRHAAEFGTTTGHHYHRYDEGPSAQARHGERRGCLSLAGLQDERHRIDHGKRALRRAQNAGGSPE